MVQRGVAVVIPLVDVDALLLDQVLHRGHPAVGGMPVGVARITLTISDPGGRVDGEHARSTFRNRRQSGLVFLIFAAIVRVGRSDQVLVGLRLLLGLKPRLEEPRCCEAGRTSGVAQLTRGVVPLVAVAPPRRWLDRGYMRIGTVLDEQPHGCRVRSVGRTPERRRTPGVHEATVSVPATRVDHVPGVLRGLRIRVGSSLEKRLHHVKIGRTL